MLLALSTGEWVKLEWVYNTEKFLSKNSWPTDMIPGIVWNFYVSFIKNLAPYTQGNKYQIFRHYRPNTPNQNQIARRL